MLPTSWQSAIFIRCSDLSYLLFQDCFLVHVLNELPGSMIMIFVRTCESTRLLALTLRNLRFKAISISGQMSQVSMLSFQIEIVRFLIELSFQFRTYKVEVNANVCFSRTMLILHLSSSFFLISQDKRLGALNRFKTKDCNILICTDVASRGLDIQGVDVVINYDIPMNSKVSTLVPFSIYILKMPFCM